MDSATDLARAAVLRHSEDVSENVSENIRIAVSGIDMRKIEATFSQSMDHGIKQILNSYISVGMQSTNLGIAMDIINEMLDYSSEVFFTDSTQKRKEEEEEEECSSHIKDNNLESSNELNINNNNKINNKIKVRKCKIFLGYTSNIISSGCRELIRYMCEKDLIDVIVATAGGIEEDIIKCLSNRRYKEGVDHMPYLGSFTDDGNDLRRRGLNRIGNIIIPNENYCLFEEWFIPLLNELHNEQDTNGTLWTPSKLIRRLGKEINDPDSVYYWCYINNIPVFCPALTDGSIGDMIYFHTYKRDGFILDIVSDIRRLNDEAVHASKTGTLILGSGLVKHHIMNANLMRNGADYSVYINSACEYDGSDSGASPDEARSWGKIKADAKAVKVWADVSLVLPLIIIKCFIKRYRMYLDPINEECVINYNNNN